MCDKVKHARCAVAATRRCHFPLARAGTTWPRPTNDSVEATSDAGSEFRGQGTSFTYHCVYRCMCELFGDKKDI